jgi:hypothetical protein
VPLSAMCGWASPRREVWPSSQYVVLLSAILGALSPKSAVLFSAICVPVLRNMRFGSPQYSLRLSAIRVLLLRNTCSGSTQYFPVLRNTRSTFPQYAFHLSAIRLPPLRNKPCSSSNSSAMAYYFFWMIPARSSLDMATFQLHILTTWYRR